MFSKIRVIAAIVVFLIAAQSPAQLARVFLSGTGDDANDCSIQATPCRSLAMAVTQCPAKGEIIVLTSGGFGSANITKPLTINAAGGVVAFNARTIYVTISSSDPVVIRGLSMQGSVFGDAWGIDLSGGGTLIVEKSIFDGFAVGGIRQGAPSTLLVNDCEFRNGSGDGLVAMANTTDVNRLTIQNSRFLNNAFAGLELQSNTNAVIKNSVISGNRFGVFAVGSSYGDPKVTVDSCVIAHNTKAVDSAGIRAQDFVSQPYDVAVRVTNSEIYGNTTGLFTANASIVSYGTNYLWDNATAGAFSSTVPRQ
jgi:hypothetical protein